MQRKYKKSYKIVTDVDPDTGRARNRAEYAGEYCRFPEGSPSPGTRALRLAPWLALFWAFAIAYLLTSRVTGHCMYALVPFLVGLMPGAYALMGLTSLWLAPARMTVVQRENGSGRLVRSTLGCGLFAAAGALGCAVYLSVSAGWSAGWHEPLLCAAASAAAWTAFALCRRDYGQLETEASLPADPSGDH